MFINFNNLFEGIIFVLAIFFPITCLFSFSFISALLFLNYFLFLPFRLSSFVISAYKATNFPLITAFFYIIFLLLHLIIILLKYFLISILIYFDQVVIRSILFHFSVFRGFFGFSWLPFISGLTSLWFRNKL